MQTARHFPLLPDGGAIRMESTDPQNSIIPVNIQRHLDSICTMLQAGNLNVPLFTQTATPAEMRSLQRVKTDIQYTFEPLPQGGQIVMSSRNPKAVQAIQQFLRMQIRRQRTGDSLVTPKSPPARKHEAGKTAGKSGSAQ